MAERSLRGMSIGAKSLESDDNVDFAARNDVAYVCPKGHRTILPFAEGAEIPDEWSAVVVPWPTVRATPTVRTTKSANPPAPTGTCCWNAVAKRNWPPCSKSACKCTVTVGFPTTSDLLLNNT